MAPPVLRDLISAVANPISQSFDLSPLVRSVNSLVAKGVAPSLEFLVSANEGRSCRVDAGEGQVVVHPARNSRCLFGADLSGAAIIGDVSGLDFSGATLSKTYFDVSAAREARIVASNYAFEDKSTCIFACSGNFQYAILGGTFRNTDFRGNWEGSREDARRPCSFMNCSRSDLPTSFEFRVYQPPPRVEPVELPITPTSREILELLERREITALIYGDSICRAHNLLFTSCMVAGALEELFRQIDVVHLVKPVLNPGYPNHTHSGLLLLSHSKDSVIAVVTDDETRLSIGHGCYLSTLFEIPFETGRGIRRIVEQVDSRFCVIDYPERMVGILVSTLLSPLNSLGETGERVEFYLKKGNELVSVEREFRLNLLRKFQENLFDLSRANLFFATELSSLDFSFSEKFRKIFGGDSYDSNS